ncbi:MAG: HesA/MoeB/ThiF family protein [Candidatus Parvarchaeota archaeon]|nr:HesA/MoeB/ThiF family protein [Candidatus Jingweiarchaeum tengchongense]MCW1298647.1 HesA/MoeB/ThiF family protein [Candidatus Jingweiarchaeum tengchongense]MCW1305885.1 HesA/MoeB/ThiF family protein [Candidatus Jingweiarchaeum tengchongense]MCW1311094.1 HesA/MoeB/ThiF family protein [Candidatus Jingweiarchaeum tengchongense]
MKLNKVEIERYSRNIIFNEIGINGQKKLKKSSIAILGLGGIGSAAAIYLTCAGIGNIRLIDRDFVELNNIQRQILYDEEDARKHKLKAIAAKEKLESMNTNISIEAFAEDFNPRTAEKLLKNVDLVIDATDNMETRFLLNEVCVKQRKTFIYGAAIRDYGALSTIIPGKTPCFRCIFKKIPEPGSLPTCDRVGVLNTVPGLIGILQATEAIKYLLGSSLLQSKLLYIHLGSMSFNFIDVKRDLHCPVCVKRKFQFLNQKINRMQITMLCGGTTAQILFPSNFDVIKLRNEIINNPLFKIEKQSDYLLTLRYGKYQILISSFGRILIKNIESEKEARDILNKII